MTGSSNRFGSVVALLLILVAAWLLWSGLYKPLLLMLGTFSCLLSVYIAHRLGFFRVSSGLHVIPRLPRYWAWLIREIVKSSIDVARIVLDPKLPISPTVVEFEAAPKGPIGVYDGRLRVHCLTREGADSLLSGDNNRRAAELTTR